MTQSRDTLEASDFTGNALIQGEYVTVATRTGNNKYRWVFGLLEHLRRGDAGNFYLDLVDSAANNISGKVQFVVYESQRLDDIKVKGGDRARGDRFDLDTLRAASMSDRQTWEVLDIQDFGAAQDEVIGMEVKVDNSTNDGNTVDTAASDFIVPITEFQQ